MATYCFVCPDCGQTWTTTERASTAHCTSPARRDYRAEGVGFATASLSREREFGLKSHKDQFLPTPADFASASDPDGQKGLREWRESVTPKSENKRPIEPDLAKKVW